jgi:hypothetical protein
MPNRIALFTSGGVSHVIGLHSGAYPLQCPLGVVGDGRLRCSETGAWDKTVPTCEPVNCGAPDFIAFADIVGGIYTLGNTVTYICQQGYIIVGVKLSRTTGDLRATAHSYHKIRT